MARRRASNASTPHSPTTERESLWRTLTRQSTFSESQRERDRYDIGDDDETDQVYPEWELKSEVQARYAKDQASNLKDRKLGVTWRNLTVYGEGEHAAVHENVLSQFNIPTKIAEGRRAKSTDTRKTIIQDAHGCMKPGEMLLVLGRPGAGCTTLLNMLANRRFGYAEVTGDVHWGSMDNNEVLQYRGQVVMNTEEEIHFPTLTVGQTMDFATRMKVPAQRPSDLQSPAEYQKSVKEFLLRSMGIEHTNDTKVGNEYVRGVSGGERKRVSITETMAARGSVYCWDNSTRGLDASTALEWTRAIRAMTDVLGLATIATLYQAGNGIYNLFDKVLVLDEGREIFFGEREAARPFMEELGFLCDDSANVADFLTGVTVPTERAIKPDFEDSFPRTAAAIQAQYHNSLIKKRMEASYDFAASEDAKKYTAEFKAAIKQDKHKSLPKKSPLTTPITVQILNCIIRQYQIIWGDKATFFIKQISGLIQALVAGSLFYNAPDTSAGLFVKGGALFYALLYNSLVAMSETTDSFTGRPVLAKHKEFAFYHPAAFCIAQIAADLPILVLQVSVFGIILYFMVGLKTTAAAFFTFWIITYTAAIAMTAFFRLVGAAFPTFDAASKVSGFAVSALLTYMGYEIRKPDMHPWFVWIYWINPLAYAFESLLANEFHGQIIPCAANNLVPSGPGYSDDSFAACTGVGGAAPGASFVTGDQYLSYLSYSHSHLWRNLGILWAWWALFAGLTIFYTNRWLPSSGGRMLLVPRELKAQSRLLANDEESQTKEKVVTSSSNTSTTDEEKKNKDLEDSLIKNTSVFTWKDLSYTVRTPSGDRLLLDNVQGWIKPGKLGALMGSSGAGKTTLMDVLAQRKTEGTIRGSIMVDGRDLPVSFQRSAGYCEQLDVHEPYATVREALEFSALLRQSREAPREEKLRYVDTVIDLLELHDLENSLIGRVGAGLSVEQRKRVTIGVELVAKPSILIFLDEPTSGLDGQAAFNTLRFLKKLAAAGQAVLCTIHQPSAQLFAQFDTLLLLARGGKTVYFGDIGENASTIKEYFDRNGAPCPADANPAEHMIDVVSGSLSKGRDWSKVWLESDEHTKVVKELDSIIQDAASKPVGTVDDGYEFAAPIIEQTKLVTRRMNIALYRNTEYVMNKVMLHIGTALFNGFSFWMIGNSVGDLQLTLFALFNFIFVAPGVIAQLQPLFIDRRDIYEAREKKSKMYHWGPFVTGLIVSELPYLVICAVLYFVCFYYTSGLPNSSSKAGGVFFVMLMYEFMYTGIGQFVAAYAPNAVFASLVNPLLIGVMASFCGVLVPYSQIQPFWRYWLYYLDPFNYLMGSLLTFTLFDKPIRCKESELAIFDTPSGQSCSAYLQDFMQGMGARMNLTNPDATSQCRVCQYSVGADYLYTLDLKDYYYGWRDAAIVVIFVISSYALVYVMMKLRTKTSKKAE
ncbi:ATPase [Exophiala aquamarina CBS 119918]|uniref:ATPase n=1 Tax=Exophiala aquamarina CBS 119918 TaxID=1182545 RepID=A0A072PJB0_9EURO|nr:ATPase [Exophiala aquamarina CBS 119918]KEF60199.1 ATPase [Exophiala aquamarina CBS 119918]